eukprot:gb/GEZN01010424.1/.p1 GENE.gb/GEZN01010424.1/~~gb/GEZN01010424.1/.p1  ORF type:complete len:109 (+),score=17.87 gb/GEZN01010424.1/:128-454(+)
MSGGFIQAYRGCTLGKTLKEALEVMKAQGDFSDELCEKVMTQFDQSMNEVLENHTTTVLRLRGDLHTYRNVDGTWTLVVQKMQGLPVTPRDDTIKIVATELRKGGTPN